MGDSRGPSSLELWFSRISSTAVEVNESSHTFLFRVFFGLDEMNVHVVTIGIFDLENGFCA